VVSTVGHVHRFELHPRVECFAQEPRTFDHERALVVARAATVEQAPKPLDLRMAKPKRVQLA
jgi:hypothetical protein